MHNEYVLEVEFRDYIDKRLLKSQHGRTYQLRIFNVFYKQLDEVIGGMLCIDHVSLPEILPPLFLDNTWILKISCCCAHQRMKVGDRLDLLLK